MKTLVVENGMNESVDVLRPNQEYAIEKNSQQGVHGYKCLEAS